MSQPPNTAQGPNAAQPANTATGQQAQSTHYLLAIFQQHLDRKNVRKRRTFHMLKRCKKAMRAKYHDRYQSKLQELFNQLQNTEQARRDMWLNQQAYNASVGDEANKYGGWSNLAEDMIDSARDYRDQLETLLELADDIGDPLKKMLAFDEEERIPLLEKGIMQDQINLEYTKREEARNRKERRDTLQEDDFIKGQPMHRFVRFGGGNPQSSLGLWIKLDNNWCITERTVIKDTSYEDEDQLKDWDNSVYWLNYHLPGQPRTPMEAHIMQRLRDSGAETVVRLRDWVSIDLLFMHRLYLEWCPYGDVSALRGNYKNHENLVPEPFIWHVFESLVYAAFHMWQGGLQSQSDWREIIHLDIKPHNIFLGLHPEPTPAKDNWNMYPTVKLGDFGLACETEGESDNRNPGKYTGRGTQGFQAPEQHLFNGITKLSADTNVYGIGLTIMSLMTLKGNYGPGPHSWLDYWESDQEELPFDTPGLTDEIAPEYSSGLNELVTQCLLLDPGFRPSLRDLLAEIQRHTRPGPGDLAEGARSSGPQDRRGLEHSLKYMRGDRYEIGRRWRHAEQDTAERGSNGYGYYEAPVQGESEEEVEQQQVNDEGDNSGQDNGGGDDYHAGNSSQDDFTLEQGAGTFGAAAAEGSDDGVENTGGDDVVRSEKSETDEEDRETVSEREKRRRRIEMKRNNMRLRRRDS